MSEKEYKILNRMHTTNDYIVRSVGAFYWANVNHKGCLIEPASSEEVYLIQKLSREGRGGLKHETFKR